MAFKLVSFFLLSLISGCAHFGAPEGVPVAMYERAGEAFLMIVRLARSNSNTPQI